MILFFSVPPEYSPSLQKYAVVEESNVTVNFQLDALPRVSEFTWLRNGVRLSSTSDRVLSAGGIAFNFIKRTDSGMYTVTATDRLGSSSATLDMTVYCT